MKFQNLEDKSKGPPVSGLFALRFAIASFCVLVHAPGTGGHMARVPVLCDTCDASFTVSIGIGGGDGSRFTLQNCSGGPCPYCGGLGRMTDGVYETRGESSELVERLDAPTATIEVFYAPPGSEGIPPNCYEDAGQLLADVKRLLQELRFKYMEARQNVDITSVMRPQVKSALEHLRSVLEYTAQDLRTRHCRLPGDRETVYFPYGKGERIFQRSIDRNLPEIEALCPEAFHLIEALQPFKCGSSWLTQLCELTNFRKHYRLGEQARVNSTIHQTTIGNSISVSNGATIRLAPMYVGGRLVTAESGAEFNSDQSLDEIKRRFPYLNVTRQYARVEFRFAEAPEDTMKFIGKCYREINQFLRNIRGYL